MMRSFSSSDEFVVNISYPSTNKAFETPEDSPDFEPSLNKLYKLLTPLFIIIIPNPILHARIKISCILSRLCNVELRLIALNTKLQVFHVFSDDYVPSPQVDCGLYTDIQGLLLKKYEVELLHDMGGLLVGNGLFVRIFILFLPETHHPVSFASSGKIIQRNILVRFRFVSNDFFFKEKALNQSGSRRDLWKVCNTGIL
ncbi:hypothetical protein Tco_0287456 [Tanacetum coccineum]